MSPDTGRTQTDHNDAWFAMKLSLVFGVLMLAGKTTAYFLTGSSAIMADAAKSVVHVAAVACAAYSMRRQAGRSSFPLRIRKDIVLLRRLRRSHDRVGGDRNYCHLDTGAAGRLTFAESGGRKVSDTGRGRGECCFGFVFGADRSSSQISHRGSGW